MLASVAPSKLSLGCSLRHQKAASRSCTNILAAQWDPAPRVERLINAKSEGTLRSDIAELKEELVAFKQEAVVARLRADKMDRIRLEIKQESETTRLQTENKLDKLGIHMKWAAIVIIILVASIFGQTDIVKAFIASIARLVSV